MREQRVGQLYYCIIEKSYFFGTVKQIGSVRRDASEINIRIILKVIKICKNVK